MEHPEIKKLQFGAFTVVWEARCPLCGWECGPGTTWVDSPDDARDETLANIMISHDWYNPFDKDGGRRDCAATEDDIILEMTDASLTEGMGEPGSNN